MKTYISLILALALLICAGCSSSIDSTGQDGDQSAGDLVPTVDEVGDSNIVVDASDYQEWAYLNLEEGIVGPDADWDLALRRTAVRLNGGASGTGSGIGQRVGPAEFSEVSTSPPSGWASDGEVDDQMVFVDWYDYNPETHILTPKPGTWFIRDGRDQNFYALVIVNYYDEAGNSGIYTLKWKSIQAPTDPPELTTGTGSLPTEEAGAMGDATDDSEQGMEESEPVESTPAHGCYPGPPTHMCDCTATAEECAETPGLWTDQCRCDERE